MHRKTTLVGGLCVLAAMWPLSTVCYGKNGVGGAVYTITHDSGSNSVVVYDRLSDGTLMSAGVVPTGGSGSGAALGVFSPRL